VYKVPTGILRLYLELSSFAVALAPELSAVYYSWGVALARHGNSPVAEAKLKDANQRGAACSRSSARRKMRWQSTTEALKYAPNWKELKEVRNAAAEHAI
jgi:hypothetical protein